MHRAHALRPAPSGAAAARLPSRRSACIAATAPPIASTRAASEAIACPIASTFFETPSSCAVTLESDREPCPLPAVLCLVGGDGRCTPPAVNAADGATGCSEDSTGTTQAEVLAAFALDASGDDALLPSTLRRELAFAAHHATHHFFIARLVAKGHLGVALPDDVGRAPATLRNDRQSASTGAYVDVGG